MIINNQSPILYNYIKQNIDDNPINLCVTTITFNALYQLLEVVDKETINIVIDKFSWDNHILKFINDDEELQSANNLSAYYRLNKLLSILSQPNVTIRKTPTGGSRCLQC